MRELTDEVKLKIRQKAAADLVGTNKDVIDLFIKLYEQSWVKGEVPEEIN